MRTPRTSGYESYLSYDLGPMIIYCLHIILVHFASVRRP